MRRAPLRGERQRALPSGHPPGLSPRTPRCCASLFRLRAGRGFGALSAGGAVLTSPPKGLRAGRGCAAAGLECVRGWPVWGQHSEPCGHGW